MDLLLSIMDTQPQENTVFQALKRPAKEEPAMIHRIF